MGWEWRCFFVPRDDAHNALACAGKPEERTDLYLPVSAACGVKARGGSSEGTLEVKIRDGVADDGFGACVMAPAVAASVFRRGAYIELTWIKWRLVHDALHAAGSVLLLDSDVVLLRNPFDHVGHAHGRRRHDIVFQVVESGM